MALNPVQRWLQSILGPYRYRDVVYADIDRTLQAIPSLSPRTDTYTYDDGRTVLLLTLQGTIPISFRGATYNIPVAYWIPHAYPREAPIAYVVPASNMLVRQSSQVDLSGLIKADFLQAWSRKWEGNNLLLLTETLQGIFSREPPLYAKPAQPQQPPPNGYTPSSPTAGPSQHPIRQAGGPRPPPPPPVVSTGQVQNDPHQQPRSPITHDHRQGSLSPSQTSQQTYNILQGQPGPPGRPQKPWMNGQSTPTISTGTHHRSASLTSVHQSPQSPSHLNSTSPGQSHSHPHPQPQAPARPPVPRVYEHNRSASAGDAAQQRQPSLHMQPTSTSFYQTVTPSTFPQQGHHGHSIQLQNQQPHHSPQQSAQTYSPQASYDQGGAQSNISQAHAGRIASPLQNQLQPPSLQQQQYQPYPARQASTSLNQIDQPSNAASPAPYIPPRPDSFRTTASPSTSKATRNQRLATPVNILDEDDDSSHISSSTTKQALPPPPRPINPALLNLRRSLYAQLVHHLHTLQAHINNENDHLRALHNDLLKGEPAILDEMQRLDAVKDVCSSVRDRMSDVVDMAQRNIENLATRPETEVDELVCGTNVVHNQLLELVAEDNALEDAIYHLSRYFNSDTRTQEELERFLKRTRILAREQFMKRSLINKILLDIALSRAQRS